MFVIKRNGQKENVHFDKITLRLKKLCEDLDIDPIKIAQKVTNGIYSGITTSELDQLAAQECASLGTIHHHYNLLASRIVISNIQKETPDSFSEAMEKLYNFKDQLNESYHLLSEDFYQLVQKNKEILNDVIINKNDYLLDYFGFKTLERAYLLKIDNKIVERPQYLWMRVALMIHRNNIERVIETYKLLSEQYFTHATPTLYNSGGNRPQLSSCYLLAMESDSIEGIYKTLTDTAMISKWAGGIGIHVSNIRGAGSLIRGTNGYATGLVPMLKVFNSTCNYINQGGKRNGSAAMYLEPWHSDIQEFLSLKKPHGEEELRARDLFYALWIPDLFMERVEKDETWSLFCPDNAPGLADVYGEDFNKLYLKYEEDKRFHRQMKAQELWFQILELQIETGMPYILYKDHCNKKSNQKNLGTIKSSNLCAEIIEYSNNKETAVCNLASICLPKFVKESIVFDKIEVYSKSGCSNCVKVKELLKRCGKNFTEIKLEEKNDRLQLYFDIEDDHDIMVNTLPQVFFGDDYIGGYTAVKNKVVISYDYQGLHKLTQIITRNLNNVIDINFYPTPETKTSNMKHRPIGIGIQGLADVFIKMRIPFDSEKAKEINQNIFETIYHGALTMSHILAREFQPYDSFENSPMSKGIFQFDMWNVTPSNLWKWEELRSDIKKDGIYNSLLIALMPTASTSQIMGNNECFEPYTSNIYTRRTLAGDFVIVNKHLQKDLIDLGIWNELMKEKLIYYNGSVQSIPEIPNNIKKLYKTAWELKQKSILDLAIGRAPFICQSQSMNIFMAQPDFKKLSSMHFYGWKNGLKTGLYYLRSQPASQAIQFTIDKKKIEQMVISQDCENCGS